MRLAERRKRAPELIAGTMGCIQVSPAFEPMALGGVQDQHRRDVPATAHQHRHAVGSALAGGQVWPLRVAAVQPEVGGHLPDGRVLRVQAAGHDLVVAHRGRPVHHPLHLRQAGAPAGGGVVLHQRQVQAATGVVRHRARHPGLAPVHVRFRIVPLGEDVIEAGNVQELEPAHVRLVVLDDVADEGQAVGATPRLAAAEEDRRELLAEDVAPVVADAAVARGQVRP